MPTLPRMYSDLAWAWPLVSPPEDYQQEAEEFTAQLRAHARRPLRTLLHQAGFNAITLDKTSYGDPAFVCVKAPY